MGDTGAQRLQGVEFKEGDVLDQRYLVLSVRRGFMGIVYLARDLSGNELVALKTFQRKFTWIPAAIESFRREAEVWMRIGWHPNIVQARRIVTIAGRPHIVMEYINGQPLRQLAKILAVQDIIDITIQICWAMQYAYDRCGIVHRDLKPDNVLITADGVAKVTDFGLAQVVLSMQSEQGRRRQNREVRRSESRDLFRGSEPYMAPEQRIPGGEIGPWSDVYAVGVMLFELLTGQLPFVAATVEELTRLHLEQAAPNPRTLMPSLPTGSEYIVGRCLEKSAGGRYRSFAELEDDLQALRSYHFGGRLTPSESFLAISEALRADGRGMAHLSLGEYEMAQRWFRAAVDLEPRRSELWIHLAMAEMALMRYKEVLHCLKRAEMHAPSRDDYVDLWRLRGEAHEQLFQLDEALADYKRIVELDRRYHQGWAGLARVLFKLARYRESLDAYSEAIRLDPYDPGLLVARGEVERTLGRRKQALNSYDQALKLNPRDIAAWCGKGACLVEMRRYEEALICYRTACSIDSDSQEAQSGLLECRRLLGQHTGER